MATVAGVMERYGAEIMNAWAAEAEKTASARGLSQPELRNFLPRYLATLGSGGNARQAAQEYLESHLASRIRQGFDLSEIVEEFVLLERCVTSLWASIPPQDRPPEADRQSFSLAIQYTIVQLTAMFQEHMLLDEQREKRYLRLLQSIADDALRTPEAPLTSRLGEVLEMLLEATGAHSACILLCRPELDDLIATASAGVAREELAQMATSLDLSSVGGRIAARPEPKQADVEDVHTELAVSEGLRRSGILSLAGIRLPPRHRLIGILLVGLREQRAFTAREIRRLEALGDRLTLHVDNAMLYADLRRHVEDLTIERDLRERFVAILAHDLRGPLAAAKVGSHLLARYPGQIERRRDVVLRLERNLDRMDRMIRDLLDVSRLRAGQRLPLRLDSCDLGAVAEGVVEELSAVHGDRFALLAPERVRGIWSQEELQRALWNLGVNAVKYGSSGTPVTIRIERTPGGARLSVHNLGNPIPPEDQDRLFSLYQRLGAGTQPGTGWGLGLAIVRACAEAHGGNVSVQSSREAGTTFSLDLPQDSRPFQRDAVDEATSAASPTSPPGH